MTELVYVVKVKHGGTIAKLVGGQELDQYIHESVDAGQKLEELYIEVEQQWVTG